MMLPIMNIGMDDDWTQNGQEQTQMQLANKKIIKQQKTKKKCESLLNNQGQYENGLRNLQ